MHTENYPALLTQSLAELADRLRLCVDHPSTETVIPAPTPRLEAFARLLSSPPPGPDPGPFAALAHPLGELTAVLRDCPGQDLSWLEPALGQLAVLLETLLARLDQGVPPAELAADPEWLGVLSRLDNAGTPLEVMDDLDACAKGWEQRWCDQDLHPAQEDELHHRWLTFRRYGDAMFGQGAAGTGASSMAGSDTAQVVLLVDSVLRREHLLHRLRERGLTVRTAGSAAEAAALAAGSAEVRAIICDDLEPSRNLSRLAGLKAGRGDWPALVLVTGATGRPDADGGRAHTAGADAVWPEPFHADPLTGLPGRETG